MSGSKASPPRRCWSLMRPVTLLSADLCVMVSNLHAIMPRTGKKSNTKYARGFFILITRSTHQKTTSRYYKLPARFAEENAFVV